MTDQSLPARLTASLATALNSRSATIDAANETTNEAGKDQKTKKPGVESTVGATGKSYGLVLKGRNDIAAGARVTGAAAAKIDNLGGANLAKSATCVSKQPLSLAYPGAMAAAFVIAYAPTYVSLAGGPWQTEQEGHGPIIMLGAAWLAWQQRRKLASATFKPAPVAGWIILIVSLLIMAVTRSQNIGVCLTLSAGRNREFSEDD